MGLIRRTHFTLSVFQRNHPPQHPSLSQVLFGQDASSHRTNAPSPQTMSVFHSLAVVPIFGFYVALTPSDHFRIDSKQFLATHQEYHSPFPLKLKERLSTQFRTYLHHQMLFHFCRNTRCHAIIRDVRAYNRACCNHTVITDSTSRKNYYSSTYPDIIADSYLLMNWRI